MTNNNEIPHSEKLLMEENASLRAEIKRLKSDQNQDRQQLNASIENHRAECEELRKEWLIVRQFLHAFDNLRNARFSRLRG